MDVHVALKQIVHRGAHYVPAAARRACRHGQIALVHLHVAVFIELRFLGVLRAALLIVLLGLLFGTAGRKRQNHTRC